MMCSKRDEDKYVIRGQASRSRGGLSEDIVGCLLVGDKKQMVRVISPLRSIA